MPDENKSIMAVAEKVDDQITINTDWEDDDGTMYAQRVYDDATQVVWEISDDTQQLFTLKLEAANG